MEISNTQLFSPSELYHENSKLQESDRSIYATIGFINTSVEIRRIISRPFSNFRGYPSVKLPFDFNSTSTAIEEVFKNRRSVRKFSGEPISLSVLAKVLSLGDGISEISTQPDGTEWYLRTSPSPGALFPIDIYCIVFNVQELDPGLYFYNPLQNSLEYLKEHDFTKELQEATYLHETISQASACIVMSAVMPRINFKYGERAYRFALLEAGHIAQNLLLAAQAESLGGLAVGGFLDDKVNAILGLDGCDEISLYMVLLGTR